MVAMTTTTLPPFQDAHVHLALIEPATLVTGGISRVIDLGGWLPSIAPGTSGEPATNHPLPHITFAGQLDRKSTRLNSSHWE